MYLNNSYLMLLGFLKYCYQKIFKPKSLKDNVIGSFVGICIVFSFIVLYLRFFDLWKLNKFKWNKKKKFQLTN